MKEPFKILVALAAVFALHGRPAFAAETAIQALQAKPLELPFPTKGYDFKSHFMDFGSYGRDNYHLIASRFGAILPSLPASVGAVSGGEWGEVTAGCDDSGRYWAMTTSKGRFIYDAVDKKFIYQGPEKVKIEISPTGKYYILDSAGKPCADEVRSVATGEVLIPASKGFCTDVFYGNDDYLEGKAKDGQLVCFNFQTKTFGPAPVVQDGRRAMQGIPGSPALFGVLKHMKAGLVMPGEWKEIEPASLAWMNGVYSWVGPTGQLVGTTYADKFYAYSFKSKLGLLSTLKTFGRGPGGDIFLDGKKGGAQTLELAVALASPGQQSKMTTTKIPLTAAECKPLYAVAKEPKFYSSVTDAYPDPAHGSEWIVVNLYTAGEKMTDLAGIFLLVEVADDLSIPRIYKVPTRLSESAFDAASRSLIFRGLKGVVQVVKLP